MTQEERFKEAKKLYETANADQRYVLETLYPELKESESEKIRKWIIDDIRYNMNNEPLNNSEYKKKAEKAIAWLEKQDEQKPIISKFHEGEWIIQERVGVYKVIEICYPCWYKVVDNKDEHYSISFEDVEYMYHLWTIQDAKKGDVLATDDGICIFDGTLEEGKYPFAYCGITERGFDSYNVNLPFSHDNNIHPATKEQCDTLFVKMKEAGYEWDAEKKELKKIEQKPTEWHREDEQNLNACLGYIPDEFLRRWLTDTIHIKYDKPAWSEDDEYYHDIVQYCLNNEIVGKKDKENAISWFQSLKDRVQPQNTWKQENTGDLTGFENAMMHIGDSFFGKNAGLDPNDTNAIKEQANLLLELALNKEWSEEDRIHYNKCLQYLESISPRKEDIEWFKSLIPQKQVEA